MKMQAECVELWLFVSKMMLVYLFVVMMMLMRVVRHQDAQLRLRLLERESSLMKVMRDASFVLRDVWRVTCDA